MTCFKTPSMNFGMTLTMMGQVSWTKLKPKTLLSAPLITSASMSRTAPLKTPLLRMTTTVTVQSTRMKWPVF